MADVINIIALIIVPILAVVLGRWLQDRVDRR